MVAYHIPAKLPSKLVGVVVDGVVPGRSNTYYNYFKVDISYLYSSDLLADPTRGRCLQKTHLKS